MLEMRVSLRYARALFDVANKENIEEQIVKDFFTVMAIKKSSKELRNLMNSPVVPHWKKTKIYEEIFTGQISEAMLRFVQLLAEKHREKLFDSIHFQFTKLYNEKHNLLPVTISTAREIDNKLGDIILDRLANFTGKKLLAEFETDKSLIGGIKIQIDDWVYDATLRTRLKLLKKQLVSSSDIEIDKQTN